MDKQTYYKAAGVIFLIIAVLHLFRAIYEWEAIMGGYVIPVWYSWVAVVIAGYLGIRGMQLAKRQ
ncbi:MAG TPA: hypothetical protein VJJ24_02180 [Candidatus Paceibacterota bacterium]